MIPTFQYKYFLVLLAILPLMLLIFLLALSKKRKTIKKIGDESLVKQLLARYKASSYLSKFIFLFLAMGLLVIAFANPRTPTGNNKVSRNGIDLMIAVDVSKSMLAQDIKPTRLDRAKQLLSRLIDRLPNDRIGIVVFAGKAYLQMPISADHSAAKMYLASATPESIPTQGTVIGDALKMCYASFNTKEKKYKAVVLISDGEDHDEGAIKTAKEMGDEGVVIHTVGIGSKEGAPIIDEASGDYKKDAEGNTVVTKLNEEELMTIAKNGNGVYQYFSSNENVVANLENQLGTMDQRNIKDESGMNYQSYFQYALALALIFLLIEMFISETRPLKSVNMKKATMLVVGLIISVSSLFAQSDKKILKDGNDAYKKKDYPAAETAYAYVLKKDAANTTAQFNLGNALYKNGKKDSAVQAYDVSIKQQVKPVPKSNAYYNKGVVLQNDKKIAECIEAYKSALRLTPNDDDARQNLQKALKQQKQQQQQDDKKKDQNQDDNKDKKKEPKPQQSKITKQDAEEKLKALMQQEKALQDKLHKVNAQAPNKPEKDW